MILYALDADPRHVSALAEDLNIPQPTVSRHLAVLRRQSLVTAKRHGASVIYQLADRRIIQVLDTMGEIMRDAIVQRTGLLEATRPA
jgi:ArsR family transcriptional regulator